jgi:hypothetical protein
MALTKRDEAKVGTFGYHEPKPAELFDERAIGSISIFQYALNSKKDAIKTISSGLSVRFERGQTDKAIKVAKRIVKELNTTGTYSGPQVTTVPTGRPVGRPKGALVTA